MSILVIFQRVICTAPRQGRSNHALINTAIIYSHKPVIQQEIEKQIASQPERGGGGRRKIEEGKIHQSRKEELSSKQRNRQAPGYASRRIQSRLKRNDKKDQYGYKGRNQPRGSNAPVRKHATDQLQIEDNQQFPLLPFMYHPPTMFQIGVSTSCE